MLVNYDKLLSPDRTGMRKGGERRERYNSGFILKLELTLKPKMQKNNKRGEISLVELKFYFYLFGQVF